MCLIAILTAVAPLHAQGRVAGRLVRVVNGDTIAVGNLLVVLHRVGRRVQGPVDSMKTDGQGRFHFAFAPDTTSLFLLSARHDGIAYFSAAIAANPLKPDTALSIVVADTSSRQAVTVEGRHLAITNPEASGERRVIDILTVRNAGPFTRVAADTSQPTFVAGVPLGVEGVDLGGSDFSADAMAIRNDSLLVFAPIPPGTKSISLQYNIPSGSRRVTLPAGPAVDTMQFLLEERGLHVTGGVFVPAGVDSIEGRTFHKWKGTWDGRLSLAFELPGLAITPRRLLTILVISLGVLLLGGAGFALHRGTRRRATKVGPWSPNALIEQVARLDAKFLGRERELSSAEWEAYQTERGRLKQDLLRGMDS